MAKPLLLHSEKSIYALDEWNGQIHAFAFSPAKNPISPLTHLNSTSSQGEAPCHSLFYPSTPARLITANYSGSTLCSVPLSPVDGDFGPETDPTRQFFSFKGLGELGPVGWRQEDRHPHGVYLVPGREGAKEDYIVVPDLGTDELRLFAIDKGTGALRMMESHKVTAGDGPRHVVFSSLKKEGGEQESTVMYVMNELSNSVSVHRLSLPSPSASSPITTLDIKCLHAHLSLLPASPFPPETTFEQWHSSELSLSPSQHQLWASNRSEPHNPLHVDLSRGQNDLLAKWELDPQTGLPLGGRKLLDSGGRTPRHFEWCKSGEWLAVAQQDSDEVVIFKVSC